MAFVIEEHTADIRLTLTADSFAGLLKDGVAGLREIMESEGKGEKVVRKISLAAGDATGLLVDFLNEVLTHAQINHEVYDSVEFEKLSETEVSATVSGYKIDRFGTDVKAVTYHLAQVKKENDQWLVSLVLDV